MSTDSIHTKLGSLRFKTASMILIQIFIISLALFFCTNCNLQESQNDNVPPNDYSYLIHDLNSLLLDAVVQDGFTPPVASRAFAYPNIAAYEAVVKGGQGNLKSLVNQLNGFNSLPTPEVDAPYDRNVVMIKAFTNVAVNMVYRDHILETGEKKLLNKLKVELNDSKKFKNSIEFGEQLAKAINEWANADFYNETRSMSKWTVVDTPGAWQPTPPKYGEAIEPHWFKLRPFAIDSNSQFRVPLSIKYDSSESSEYMRLIKEVYKIVNESTEEHLEIAKFWDCNPSPSEIHGHLMVTNRQNTPGGHWLGITRIAAKRHNLNLEESCEILAKVGIAVADGFKVAWDTKYATNFVRPETFIQQYIDKDWTTKLETPLFPEFTSAHSLISSTAATVLTNRFGDTFSYTDSVNVAFGYAPRNFNSFYEAADEAAMSRVYGGIHYIPSCDIGKDQGKKVGQMVIDRLKTR